jgi:hypothetical protein
MEFWVRPEHKEKLRAFAAHWYYQHIRWTCRSMSRFERKPLHQTQDSRLMSIGGGFNLPSASGPASSPNAKLVNIAGDFVHLPAFQSFPEYLITDGAGE